MKYKNRPPFTKGSILILGFGTTGQSCLNYLNKNYPNINVYIYDDNLPDYQNQNINYNDLDLVLKSPGIKPDHKILQKINQKNTKIWNDIEFFYYELTNNKKYQNNLKIIAITGTNGKSTVTAMTDFVLHYNHLKSKSSGNIGISPLEFLPNIIRKKINYLVLELSSYQLENLENFQADIGVILNITPDHLDRYKDFEEYKNTKLKLQKLSKYCINSNSNIKLPPLKISGQHNITNAQFVYDICSKLNILSKNQIINGIINFTGLEHRCQDLGVFNEIRWYNDSKATNLSSCIAAINGLGQMGGKLILILGGQAKLNNSPNEEQELITNINQYCQAVICFGQDRNYFYNLIMPKINQNNILINIEENLKSSVELARKLAQPGHSVLLSPAAASFDQFKNYIERGNVFKDLVATYA